MPLYALLSAGTVVALWRNTDPTNPIAQGYVDTTGWSGDAPCMNATLSGTICTAPVVTQPVITKIDALDYINRFTLSEQAACLAINPLWGIDIAAAGTIDTLDPRLTAQLNAAIAAGVLTSARVAVVQNLSQPSP